MTQQLTIRVLFPACTEAGLRGIDFTQLPSLKALSKLGSGMVSRLMRGAVDELLDMNMAERFVRAWSKYRELSQAATVEHGKGELVALYEHTLTSNHEPKLELTINGTPMAPIAVQLELRLHIQSLQLFVHKQRVLELRLGEVRSEARLSIENVELLKQPFTSISVPGSIDLSPGILLSRAESEADHSPAA